jgi:hypothetical protein
MPENINDSWVAQQHLVCIAASAVTTFYFQCICILMASTVNPSTTTSQQWTDTEIEAILEYFIAKKSEIGKAGNFNKKTYAAAAETIQGHPRTWEQVKTKWQGVSRLDLNFLTDCGL